MYMLLKSWKAWNPGKEVVKVVIVEVLDWLTWSLCLSSWDTAKSEYYSSFIFFNNLQESNRRIWFSFIMLGNDDLTYCNRLTNSVFASTVLEWSLKSICLFCVKSLYVVPRGEGCQRDFTCATFWILWTFKNIFKVAYKYSFIKFFSQSFWHIYL